MLISARTTRLLSLNRFIGFALVLLAGNIATVAQAQVPAVLAFGARTQVQGYPVGTAKTSKIARDAAGDIFFLNSTPAVYEIPVNGPVQIVVPSTDVSMTSGASALAVDPAGNIYVGETSKIYEVPRNANGTYGTTVQIATNLNGVTGGFYGSNDIAVDGFHNIYLVVPAQGSGNGAGIITINSGLANTAGTGGKYVYGSAATATTPTATTIAVDAAGDLFYADLTNAWEYPIAQLQSSTTLTPIQVGSSTSGNCTGCSALTTPKYVTLDVAGNLWISTTSSLYLIPKPTGGYSSTSPTYLLPNGDLKIGAFANFDNEGNLYAYYSGAIEFYGAAKLFLQPQAGVTVGTPIPVGGSSTTTYSSPSLFFFFTQPETLAATPLVVVTNGSANGGTGPSTDSVNTSSGSTTCTANLAIAAGGNCSVELSYTIHDPGAIAASLQLNGTTGLLASFNVTSIGTGSAVTVDGGVTTTVGTGYEAPAGVAIDTTGAAYVADPATSTVYKYVAGSTAAGTAIVTSTSTIPGGTAGVSEPSGVALDPAGNLYIADTAHDRIVVVSNPGLVSSTVTAVATVLATPGYSLSSPHGVAVDSFGNIFISDTGAGRVLEVANPFSTAFGTTPTVVASGLTSPYGIAFDAYNNLVIADNGANAVYEVPTALLTTSATANVGSGTLVAVGTGFSAPTGVATDASGSVYVADAGNKRIVKVPSISGALTTANQTVLVSNLDKPYGIATDLTADIYYTDQAAPSLGFIKRSAPSGSNATTIGLGTVTTGSTGTTTATISNAGLTTSLTFGATPVSTPAAPFSLGSNTCSSSTPLTPGNSCSVGVSYAPTATGNSTGGFTITDNALAVTTATQLISLTGDATGAVATLALSGPSSIVYGDTAIYKITAKDASGNVVSMPSGTAYSLTITGGAGSASPYAGTFNSTGTLILPTLGASGTAYSITVTINSITSSPAVTLNIGTAPLYVTPPSVSRVFDTAMPALAAPTVSGFANGDTAATVFTTAPASTTAVTRVTPYGSYPITASGAVLTSAGAANYTLVYVAGVYSVTGAVPQSIIFPALPGFTHGATTYTLTGQSTSGLPLTYAVTGASATVSGNVLTVTATGTVTITAAQNGNSTFAAATQVSRSFVAQ